MTGTLAKILGLLLLGYVGLVAFTALTQTTLLFPRWAVAPAPPLPASAETLRLDRPDGVTLHGHRLPGQGDGPPILAFGGNAWNATDLALFLHRLLPEHDVIAFHFRGYAPSTGRPSAQALAEDALAIHDHLADRGLPPPLVAGLSIGTGPAAELAAARPTAGLLLVTPFDSLEGLARTHYPWAPVRWLLRHRMEPAAALADAPTPVAIIAAEADGVIPPAHTEALRDALIGTTPGLVFDRILPADHNSLYGHPTFAGALREAVSSLRAAAP